MKMMEQIFGFLLTVLLTLAPANMLAQEQG